MIEDMKLTLKNDRRVWAVASLAVVALVLWSVTEPKKHIEPCRKQIIDGITCIVCEDSIWRKTNISCDWKN